MIFYHYLKNVIDTFIYALNELSINKYLSNDLKLNLYSIFIYNGMNKEIFIKSIGMDDYNKNKEIIDNYFSTAIEV